MVTTVKRCAKPRYLVTVYYYAAIGLRQRIAWEKDPLDASSISGVPPLASAAARYQSLAESASSGRKLEPATSHDGKLPGPRIPGRTPKPGRGRLR